MPEDSVSVRSGEIGGVREEFINRRLRRWTQIRRRIFNAKNATGAKSGRLNLDDLCEGFADFAFKSRGVFSSGNRCYAEPKRPVSRVQSTGGR